MAKRISKERCWERLNCKYLTRLKNLTGTLRGLYYKRNTIVNDNSSVVNKLKLHLLTMLVIIYDCRMFIVQATA
jgi:hypothetical protein